MAPVSTLGPQATSLKTPTRNRFYAASPLLKRRSAPRPGSATHGYQKIRIRNNGTLARVPDRQSLIWLHTSRAVRA